MHATKNECFRSTFELVNEEGATEPKAGESRRKVAKKGKDRNNNADSSVNEGDEQVAEGLTSFSADADHIETSDKSTEEVQEARVPSLEIEETKADNREIPAFGKIQPEIVEGVEEAKEVAEFRENCCCDVKESEEPAQMAPSLDDERLDFYTNQNRFVEEKNAEENLEVHLEGWSGPSTKPRISPSEQEAETNCMQSCPFTGIDSPNIIMKNSQALCISGRTESSSALGLAGGVSMF